MKNARKNKFVNAIRILGIEAINKANSGHPGIVLGSSPIIYSLFTKIMNINPKNPNWINRDRFVLSAGHGSAMLYSILHLCGYDLSINDLMNFRQIDSKAPGHPEFAHTAGVDATTGPLGQGIANAVGMAIAEESLASNFNKKNFKVFDHYTYVLCGDGDLQEGISQEAISLAGKLQLKKLILIHDSNDIQLDGPVINAQSEDIPTRFKASNWNVIKVINGEDLDEISKAILEAKKSEKPTYIEVKTIIGIGATNQGTQKVHGAPLGNDIKNVKEYFGWNLEPFKVDDEIYNHFQKNVLEKGIAKNNKWEELFKKYKDNYKEEGKKIDNYISKKVYLNKEEMSNLNKHKYQATRVSSGEVFEYLSIKNENIIGGSADLCESTKIKGYNGNFDINNRSGRNICYGVREFAMAAINNGIALHGIMIPVASGFFIFSDYMKAAIRLSCLSKLQTIYVFSHDSVAVGEDGPTHQPVEQLAMLRSIPNISVYRPCDMSETSASYYCALKDKHRPSVILVTRQNLKELEHKTDVYNDVSKGGYIISDDNNPLITIIATGSEVEVAFGVKKILKENNISTRIVSMNNMNIFDEQPEEYKNKIIDKKTKRFSIELASTFGWHKYLGDDGFAFGWNDFGYSAPFSDVLNKIKFSEKNIANEIIKKING